MNIPSFEEAVKITRFVECENCGRTTKNPYFIETDRHVGKIPFCTTCYINTPDAGDMHDDRLEIDEAPEEFE